MDSVLTQARTISRAQAGAVYLHQADGLRLGRWQSQGLLDNPKNAGHLYLDLVLSQDQNTLAGRVDHDRQPVLLPDGLSDDPDGSLKLDVNPDPSLEHVWSRLALPLDPPGGAPVGVLELINPRDEQGRKTVFSLDCISFLQGLTPFAATAILRANMLRDSVLRNVRQVQVHDPWESPEHTQRVGAYSAEIYQRWAQGRGLDATRIGRGKGLIRLAAMNHDLGKAAISGAILQKPGKVSSQEFNEIKKHTMYGARLFDPAGSELDRLSHQVTLGHHERFDGAGYPGEVERREDGSHDFGPGIAGEKIPLAARVAALADVFDALISERAYKKPWPEDKVLKTIQQESGRHFDPELVQAFFDIYEVIGAIRARFPDRN
jgi:hypothetical protein